MAMGGNQQEQEQVPPAQLSPTDTSSNSSSPQSSMGSVGVAAHLPSAAPTRPSSMPMVGSARAPPPSLGPFPAGRCHAVPPSPICLSLLTPGIPFNPTPLQSASIIFEWPSQASPMSPITPLSPANTLYNQPLLSRQSSFVDYRQMQRQQQHTPQQPQHAPSIKHTWYQTFDQLFGQFREPWMLRQIDKDTDEPRDPGWATEEYWAKVRFICETDTCPNQWTSMRGVIRFWYTTALRPYYAADGRCYLIRELLFRAFGQKCAKCGHGQFQQPMWYEREVKKVLTKVYEHIARTMYNWFVGSGGAIAFANGAAGNGMMLLRQRVESQRGTPTAEHKSELCQGCANNTCSLSTQFRNRSRSFKSSLPQLEQIRESSRSPNIAGALAPVNRVIQTIEEDVTTGPGE